MKNFRKPFLTAIVVLFMSSFSINSSYAFEEEELDDGLGGGTVVCECAGAGKCKAGGGAASCHNGSKCWKSNANC
jgi:hypothetical protein